MDEATVAEHNRPIVDEFRANDGQVGGPFEGASLVLLTTTGARTGKRTTSPLVFVADGDRYLVLASNAGAAHHPAWYHNVLADPEVTIEIGGARHPATAVPLSGAERDRQFDRMAALIPRFADYQAGTDRVLPVVALTPRPGRT
ncbi:nitroreductase family deazaflavin-dependent oxidoreductase [Haloactinopolyspora alba]|nr:nitroreductase family deazaflavin-dependent oxidoreductase [Haloactinopolyspora alba]